MASRLATTSWLTEKSGLSTWGSVAAAAVNGKSVKRNERFFISESPRLMPRSEEHTSELQSLMRISYAVFCLKKKKQTTTQYNSPHISEEYKCTSSYCILHIILTKMDKKKKLLNT